MTMRRDTSAIGEQAGWADDFGTAPSRRTDAPRTVEPRDDPLDADAAHGIGGPSPALRPVLLLDEIGDLPLELQPKLLRVLEEQEFERLGSTQTIRSDVRVVAATNRPLEELVHAGTFRADLYYRLNVFSVELPALRERPEDVPLLVRHFVAHHARQLGRRIESIPLDVMDTLVHHSWPGNIRELQNAIHRAVILSPGTSLQLP